MSKIKVATSWLDGCSGCHMSLLDIDEKLVELAEHIEMVYGPLVDGKELNEVVDLAIVEGAISNEDDLEKALKLRKNSKFLISLGDCAVTGNVPAMRNSFGNEPCFQKAYFETASMQQQIPNTGVPPLLTKAQPLHEKIKVDLFVQGCPPNAKAIWFVLSELLEGRVPDPTTLTRFG